MFKVCGIIGISKVEFLKDCPLYHLVCEIAQVRIDIPTCDSPTNYSPAECINSTTCRVESPTSLF